MLSTIKTKIESAKPKSQPKDIEELKIFLNSTLLWADLARSGTIVSVLTLATLLCQESRHYVNSNRKGMSPGHMEQLTVWLVLTSIFIFLNM